VALRQYLDGPCGPYSQLFLSSGCQTLPDPLLLNLQAHLVVSEATPSQIEEILTFLGRTVRNFTSAAGVVRSPSVHLGLMARHAGLLSRLYGRHKHLARTASLAAHTMLEQIRLTKEGGSLSSGDMDRLMDVVWGLLFSRPDTAHAPGDGGGGRLGLCHKVGWECRSCACTFLPLASASLAEHCMAARHVTVTCIMCAEEVSLGKTAADLSMEILQVKSGN
jgi:hypothetical protein